MAATFLQLPEALGGVRFGPFQGIIKVGSDPSQCSLSLDPTQGVHPVHATLTPQASGTYVLAPSLPEAGVFLQPKGQTHLWPVRSPVSASPGDVVVFGTPMGPRFEIQCDTSSAPAEEGKPGLAKRSASEVQRQVSARILSTPGPIREVYHMVHRIRSGSFNNPRTLVMFGVGAVTLLAAGTVSCSGIGYYLMHYVVK